MRKIVEDIIARLTEKVPALRYVAQDWGQLTFFSPTPPPVRFPCALINIQSGTFENVGMNTQFGLLQVQVDVADVFNLTSAKAPAGLKGRELAFYDLVQEVYCALQGWSGGNTKPPLGGEGVYSSFNRSNYVREVRKDGITAQTLTFTINWQDDSAMPKPLQAERKEVIVTGNFLKPF
jgi:hypothetical protein